jgi:hypothetical protein
MFIQRMNMVETLLPGNVPSLPFLPTVIHIYPFHDRCQGFHEESFPFEAEKDSVRTIMRLNARQIIYNDDDYHTMTVDQAYQTYQTPKGLQEHMLRTAALAAIILEGWTGGAIDKDAIIRACTIHDIAKPMRFDPDKQTQFGMSPVDIEKLRKLQIRIRINFGSDEHHATVGIAREIGCNASIIRCIDNLEWKYIPRLLEENNLESLIPIYCDMRIGPRGILRLDQRITELRDRTGGSDYEDNMKNGRALEDVVTQNTKTDLGTITDSDLNQRFSDLRNLELTP